MDDIAIRFGARVRELRQVKGISRERVAELVGVSVAVVGLIETGKRFVSASSLAKLAQALECRVMDLFDFENTDENEEHAAHIISMLSTMVVGLNRAERHLVLELVSSLTAMLRRYTVTGK
jgi:transcriptional regulator with XRE-family HTH domain